MLREYLGPFKKHESGRINLFLYANNHSVFLKNEGDRDSYEFEICLDNHPQLDVILSGKELFLNIENSNLNIDVRNWLEDNNIEYGIVHRDHIIVTYDPLNEYKLYKHQFPTMASFLGFNRKQDLMLFKLRWL